LSKHVSGDKRVGEKIKDPKTRDIKAGLKEKGFLTDRIVEEGEWKRGSNKRKKSENTKHTLLLVTAEKKKKAERTGGSTRFT